uniref:hypothetical protein n=1 Tax=Enterocloster clostridioformis TaxID=1531 RepID=UPI0026EAD8C3|nr:hypothetical protein [Enterocloster clostridioformis]
MFKNEKGESVFYRFYLNSATDELPVKGGYLHFVRRAAGIVLRSLKKDEKSYYRVRAEVYALIADWFIPDIILHRQRGHQRRCHRHHHAADQTS